MLIIVPLQATHLSESCFLLILKWCKKMKLIGELRRKEFLHWHWFWDFHCLHFLELPSYLASFLGYTPRFLLFDYNSLSILAYINPILVLSPPWHSSINRRLIVRGDSRSEPARLWPAPVLLPPRRSYWPRGAIQVLHIFT